MAGWDPDLFADERLEAVEEFPGSGKRKVQENKIIEYESAGIFQENTFQEVLPE